MKYLLVGLGNPGPEYRDTRHNIGFMILDALAGASGSVFRDGRHAWFTEVKHAGRTLVLVKPTTYMNLSGKAVRFWLDQEKIPLERLLVITDDIALPTGKLRIRPSGSDGGHNGLKSIQTLLNSNQYARLRFGVGNDFPKGMQADYVLSDFPKSEQNLIDEKINTSIEIIKSFVTRGIGLTMTEFNK